MRRSTNRIARCAAVAAATAVTVVAIGAAAQSAGAVTGPTTVAPLHTDGQGVSIINSGGIAFEFGPQAAARYKAIAGHRVAISCGSVSNASGGLLTSVSSPAVLRPAPATGSVVTSGIVDGADYCSLGLVKSHRRETLMAVVPETRRGALFLNQDTDVRVILSIFFYPGAYIAKQESVILAEIDGVALPTETSRIPAGKFGLYYRPNHLYIGTRDAAGVLVFVRDDMATIASNLLGFLSKQHVVGVYVGQTLPLP